MTLCFFSGDGNFSRDIINMRLYCLCMNESFNDNLSEDCVETHDTWSPRNMVIIIDDLALLPQMSFAFFCCHLRYAGFGHINQKLSPYCTRGSSRKQYSHIFMWKLRGSAFCRNLSLCLLHFLWATYKDIVYRHILRFIRCSCFTWAVVNTSWQRS